MNWKRLVQNIYKNKKKKEQELREKIHEMDDIILDRKVKFFSSIRFKLILSFVIPLALIIMLGFISYAEASKAMVESYKSNITSTVQSVTSYYKLGLDGLKTKGVQLMSDKEINSYHSGFYKEDLFMDQQVSRQIQDLYGALVAAEPMTSAIYSISEYGRTISSKGSSMNNYYKEAMELWGDTTGNFKWVTKHEFLDQEFSSSVNYGMALMIKLTDANGFIILDVNEDELTGYLNSISIGNRSIFALVTNEGYEFFGTKQEKINELVEKVTGDNRVISTVEFYQAARLSGNEFVSDYVDFDGEKYLFLYNSIGDTESSICYLIPNSVITAQAKEIKTSTMMVSIFASIVLICIGTYISLLIRKRIQNVTQKLNLVATGDLTVTFENKTQDEFTALSDGVTNMLCSIRGLVSNMKAVNEKVLVAASDVARVSDTFYTSTQEISSALGEVAEDVVQQAGDADSCLAEMNKLSVQVREVYNGTEVISTISTQTNQIVMDGLGVVDELSDKIKETSEMTHVVITDIEKLAEESKNIGQIIDVINGIAEETNLLSLNASIEAARAGEAGRGFAVVADEIRKLADQSKESVSQIARIVNNIQSDTAGTVKAARNAEVSVLSQECSLKSTVQMFDSIKSQFDILVNQLDTITTGVRRIELVKDQTLSAIENISTYTQETSAVTEEVSATSLNQMDAVTQLRNEAKTLEEEAEKLNKAISKFKI